MEAIQQLGGAVKTAGGEVFDIAQREQKRIDAAAAGAYQNETLQFFAELDNKYAQDTDYATLLERFDSEVEQRKPKTRPGVSTQVQEIIEQNFKEDLIRYRDRIEGYRYARIRDAGRAAYLQGLDTIANAAPQLGVEDSKKKIDELVERTIRADLITAEEGQRHKIAVYDNLTKIAEKAERAILMQWVWNLAKDFEKLQPGAGLEMLHNVNYFPDLTLPEREELQENLKYLVKQKEALEKEAIDKAAEAEELEIIDQIDKGTATWEMIKVAPHISAGRKNELRKQAEARAEEVLSGKGIITDQRIKTELEADAYKIWTGGMTMLEFKRRLNSERFGKKTIDAASYDELMTKARTEFKTQQAQSLSSAITAARQQLVTYGDETSWGAFMAMLDDEGKKAQSNKRQLEFWNLSQFDNEMRAWLAKNPDATRDEFYVQQTKLLAVYRKRTQAEIERLQQQVESDVLEIPAGLENIWSELTDEEKQTARAALSQGRTAQEITEYFKNAR